ncbi:nonstructural protein [Tortoise microvirus 25]|nr:nonstructural protein [Tortoise microvirus 25]
MIQRVYVIKNDVTETTTPLFFSRNDETARREFTQFLSPPDDAKVTLDPSEFSLHYVGDFDDVKLRLDIPTGTTNMYLCNGNNVIGYKQEAIDYVP